ncbi:MAG: response regulator [Caulobacteraceae bacterium]|nr:response regulator [Caulobacteraceae bacterium]
MAQHNHTASGALMKVLLIDDETVAARRLERLTRSVLGDDLRVLAVAHGLSEAKQLLSASAFDLILLDLNLSGDDGFALLADEIGGRR